MKVAALGRTSWLYNSIVAVRQRGHQIALIATAESAPEYQRREADFAHLAAQCGCPFFCTPRLKQETIRKALVQSGAEVAISVNWPTLIPGTVLQLFPHGILNFHAGDLPRYRGNACPNWAILAGEEEVVVTVHQMVQQLDAGAIWCQRRLPLDERTYIGHVYHFIEKSAPEMFVEALAKIAAGQQPLEQPRDPSLALRCFPRLPRDSQIDWQQPAEQICRLVRASAEPFPGAYTWLGRQQLIIWRARPDRLACQWHGVPGQVAHIDRHSGEVLVLAGRDIVTLEQVSLADQQRQAPAALIRSSRTRLGLDVPALLTELADRVADLQQRVEQLEAHGSHAKRSVA